MRIQLQARTEPSRLASWSAAPLAIGLTAVLGFVFLTLMGQSPALGWQAFISTPFGSLDGWSELLLKAAPLMLIGLGLAPGFRSGVWNIGAEGQLIIGGIAAAAVAIAADGHDQMWVLPTMLLAGAVAGAAWAAIPAWLRITFNTNEILVSLMLVYVATAALNYAVYGPMKDPMGMGFPQSILFGDAAVFTPLAAGYRINFSIVISLVAALLCWVFLIRSFAGFQLQVGGLAPMAASYAGFSANRAVWTSMLVGGACAGVAGSFEVAGPLGQLTRDVSNGYGFGAIIVAFLGRLHPGGIVLASLLIAALYIGGEKAQVLMDLPSSITGLFQGLLLLILLACQTLGTHRLVRRR